MTATKPGSGSWAARAAASGAALRSWPGVVRRSIKLRLVLLFLLLAVVMTAVLLGAGQRAFSVGWREAARPLLADYVDHLSQRITAGGPTPLLPQAQALVDALPLRLRISGPAVNWTSHPARDRWGDAASDHGSGSSGSSGSPWRAGDHAQRGERQEDRDGLFARTTADGHRIDFRIDNSIFGKSRGTLWLAIAALLLTTFGAWWTVRRLLLPLDDIRQGAQRFGAGNFSQPIRIHHPLQPDELGQLAATVNTMGQDILQMLEAKRALLLAISHELRSPLTRARLHTELLPETVDVQQQRLALLRDLQLMGQMISDLLESERLASKHAALQREPLDLTQLAGEVIAELMARPSSSTRPNTSAGKSPDSSQARTPATSPSTSPSVSPATKVQAPVAAQQSIQLLADPQLPRVPLDAHRMRLLLRNLLDNALRHSAQAALPPELHLRRRQSGRQTELEIEVRDHGPGVPDDQLPRLTEAFYRPDSARTRAAGGVGLGLYLCQLVAQAHGGSLSLSNAQPGLRATVTLPISSQPAWPLRSAAQTAAARGVSATAP